MKTLLLGFICAVMIASGQLLWKMSFNQLAIENFLSIQTIKKVFSNPLFLSGFFIYGMATVFWMYLLNNYKLSHIYPVISLTYVVSLIASALLLKESIPFIRWIGVIVICAGIILVVQD